MMFNNFESRRIKTQKTEINLKIGGRGPALLLLHGYPQTHIMWHKIAPELAHRFTVVATDLRGYGDSGKPPTDAKHEPYSKVQMAKDQAEVMTELGFEDFFVVGHDRGGRVAHRLARDYFQRVKKVAVLDIAPTTKMYSSTDKKFATAYYHWFFLIQPFDFPERLIGADPRYYLEKKIKAWGRANGAITRDAFDEYLRCFSDPQTIHATCEDYRAAASIDLVHDTVNTGSKLETPLLALWGKDGFVGQTYDVIETWREVALDVSGGSVPGGHYLPEEAPAETLKKLQNFL
ncbi:MAG: alpha/beta hydrolase [Paracoccaceae bacterium]|nr:alpha/beta hydrolase [Paracoccaceae bacterium]